MIISHRPLASSLEAQSAQSINVFFYAGDLPSLTRPPQ
jgi:hypothetical protein